MQNFTYDYIIVHTNLFEIIEYSVFDLPQKREDKPNLFSFLLLSPWNMNIMFFAANAVKYSGRTNRGAEPGSCLTAFYQSWCQQI